MTNEPETCDVLVENWYGDGHESKVEETGIPAPESIEEIDEWWEDVIYPLTGDGHGEQNPRLDSVYTVTVIAGPDWLVGMKQEWGL